MISICINITQYNTWTTTLRRPVDGSAASTRSNNNMFASIMDQNRVSLRDRVYNLFVTSAQFVQVSTEASGAGTGNPSSHDSFEGTHDSIHVIAGGESGGHMYYVDYSSFDPVFWLHHTSVIASNIKAYRLILPQQCRPTDGYVAGSSAQLICWHRTIDPECLPVGCRTG